MSKERQKARAARQAARRAEVEAAARKRARRAKVQGLVPSVTVPRRRRRYGALPLRVRFQLVALFLAVQVLAWFFLHGAGARFSVAVLTAACLLVLVNTRRSSPR
ncbi:MAG: hypothetical protein JWM02_872 [Frankiales bacterium]|nr:hypothetical protein [Frankiales bacterium]